MDGGGKWRGEVGVAGVAVAVVVRAAGRPCETVQVIGR